MNRLKINLAGISILVTGAVGFISSNLMKKMCEASLDNVIVCIDNMNDYYDSRLKVERLNELF